MNRQTLKYDYNILVSIVPAGIRTYGRKAKNWQAGECPGDICRCTFYEGAVN
ncbi:hypothetical protein PCURB6_06610 [Paenibacillus curdlanolyticus]|nr:hypothetical protein PCURB6_06610 [Paenibacillus curdlanolyticus]